MTESRHQTMALRLDRDRLADEPIQSSFADVMHRVSRPVITMPGRIRGVITRNNASTNMPMVARNLLTGPVNASRRDRKRTALNRPGARRDTPSKRDTARRKDDDCSPQTPRRHVPEADTAASARLTPLLLMATVVSAISALLYGYDTGIISGALLQIARQFHTGNGVEQIIASSILLGAVIGALSCSKLSERWGRHRTMLLVSAIFIVGALACSVAPTTWALSLSRVVLGFAVGGATQTIPMYGRAGAGQAPRAAGLDIPVGIGVGIVASTIIGASQHFSWRVSLGMAAVPATLMLILMLRLPESPRWLVKRDDHDGARKVLERIRPPGFDVSGELQDIVEVEDLERKAGVNRGWHGLRQRWVRPALIAGCGIAVFTQLSGIEMIIYYAPTSV